jgi:molecular chaperone GrpE
MKNEQGTSELEDAEQEDIILDEETGIDDSVLVDVAQGDTIKKLKLKLKDAEGKAKENLDNWQRAQAEFMNVRKRDEDARSEFAKFAKADTISQIIPVLDSFTMALNQGHEDLEPIYNQLFQILKQNGLEESNPLGEMFDPAKHEAISMKPTDIKEQDHTVLEVFQRGYMLNGSVLRAAKVRVGEFTEADGSK